MLQFLKRLTQKQVMKKDSGLFRLTFPYMSQDKNNGIFKFVIKIIFYGHQQTFKKNSGHFKLTGN